MKKKKEQQYTGYILVKCEELCDQYECDADRKLICYTSTYDEAIKKALYDFKFFEFEIYGIRKDGAIRLVNDEDYDTLHYKFYNLDLDEEEVPWDDNGCAIYPLRKQYQHL